MLYYGSFRSLLDNKEYYVQIITNNSTAQSAEIKLGPNAFSVNMDAGNSLYETLHSTTASIEIVSDGTSFDMFSAQPKQNKVRLFEVHRGTGNVPSYRLMWTGYTQPCTYSTPFTRPTDTWSLECVDEIGVLQYLDYEAGGVTETEMSDGTVRKNYVKRNNSFADIIENMMGDVLAASQPCLHYPHKNYLNRVLVSECNFFNEDDEAMKCSEVLSEMCKHMGCYAWISYDNTFANSPAAAAENYHLSLIDIDFIPANKNTSNVSYYTLTKGDIIGGNATLSLDPVYNKVTVKDSMYTVENLMPSMWEEEDLVNIMSYPWTDGKDTMHDAMFGGYTSRHYCIEDKLEITSQKYGYWQWYGKYYLNKKFQDISRYPSSITGKQRFNEFPTFGKDSDFTYPTYLQNNRGAFFCKMDVEWIGNKKAADAWSQRTFYLNKHKYEFSNYLMLNLNDSSNPDEVMISFQDAEVDKKPFFTNTGTYLILTGSIQVDDRENIFFPLCDYGESEDTTLFWNIFLYAELKLSMGIPGHEVDYYWSNSSGWVTTPTKFELRFYDDRESLDHSVHINGKTYDIMNNVTPDMGIDKNGYVIPMPKPSSDSQFVPSVPQLTIYGRGRINSSYRIDRVWLKDFDLQVFQPKIGGAEEENSDTEYTYYIDTNNVQDFEDVEFKICSWDGKNVNYSVPILTSQGFDEFSPITTVFNDNDFAYNAEELYAYKVVNQYRTPTKRESVTLRGTNLMSDMHIHPVYIHDPVLNIDCVVDKYTFNYASDTIDADIVEKKIIDNYE